MSLHPYVGMSCMTPNFDEGVIAAVGQSSTRERAVMVAVVLLPSGAHEEFELTELELLDASAARRVLLACWALRIAEAGLLLMQPPLGWRTQGAVAEQLVAVPAGEPHETFPEWRAAVDDLGQPDGWIRKDGLHLHAGHKTVIARRGYRVVFKETYEDGVPQVSVAMKVVNENHPMSEDSDDAE